MREHLLGIYAYGVRVSLHRGATAVAGFVLLLVVLFAELSLA